MAEGKRSYGQKLEIKDQKNTFSINPKLGEASFKPVNTNGAQRGWRPIVHFLPHRVKSIEIVEGKDLEPVINDNYILIPNPRNCDPTREYRVSFTAEKI